RRFIRALPALLVGGSSGCVGSVGLHSDDGQTGNDQQSGHTFQYDGGASNWLPIERFSQSFSFMVTNHDMAPSTAKHIGQELSVFRRVFSTTQCGYPRA